MKITAQGYAIIENDSHIGKWVEENKRLDFDQNAQPLINQYLKPGDTVIDAGANIGCYSFGFLDAIGKTGSIHAFEPSEEAFECLEYNLDRFNNIFLYNKALASKEGYVKVISENDNKGMNFCEQVKESTIKAITIDSLSLKQCDFIKIDVEGWELDVLVGGSRTIDRFRPKLYIEINSHTLSRVSITKDHIFEWLKMNGYTYKNIYTEQGLIGDQFDIIAEFVSF